MAVVRWDPFSTLARLDRDFDELVRRTWPTARRTTGYVPAVEMVTSGSDVIVNLELPGLDVDKDVVVEIENGRLVVRGERRDEHEDRREGLLVREFHYGSFRREFALPEGVTADAIEASYEAGVLKLRVNGVAKPAEPVRKRIPVTVAPSEAPAIEPGEPEHRN
ncbi:MAG: Hsp20/alpha crystallin family protein [Frankiaceae bacterium]